MISPVVLFVYNRLWHTQQTISSLLNNSLAAQSDLIIFSDGPKTEAEGNAVQSVRSYLKSIMGFNSIRIFESEFNKGLANSIIDGVCLVLREYESIIVLEDDMITSPYFLNYMNEGLQLYQNDEDVISIHGYVYPVKERLPESFFLKGADCWGWATWRRGWIQFESDGAKLLRQLESRGLTKEFDFNNSYPYTRMLKRQIEGKNDSWAIRWYASAFLNSKLTLYPGVSLINNIGNDSSGTHSWDKKRFETHIGSKYKALAKIEIQENIQAKRNIGRYFRRTNPSLFKKMLNRIKVLGSSK